MMLGYLRFIIIVVTITNVQYIHGSTCPDLQNDSHMISPYNLTGYKTNDTVTFKCTEGYELIGVANLTCNENEWDGPQPRCKGIPCPDFKKIPRMKQPSKLDGYRYPDTVSFTCVVGYKLSGSTTLNCLDTGRWNSDQPTCKVVTCPNLVSKPHQTEDPTNLTGYQYLDYVNFQCESGYKLEGRASITCEASGNWSSPQPNCTAKPCPDLKHITHMKQPSILTGFRYPDSTVHFICDDGYNLMGNTKLSCMASGQWNGQQPTCTAVPCPDLMLAPHMLQPKSLTGYFYLNRVDFTCEFGFELVGHGTLTCTTKGQWDNKEPICIRVACPSLTMSQNVLQPKRLTGYRYNDTVTYICNTGYTLSGPSVLTCLGNGTWDSHEHACVVCDDGYFGENCAHHCHCAVKGCDAVNGKCNNITGGCQFGWRGSNCSISIICTFENSLGSLNAIPHRSLYNEGDNVTFFCNSGYTGTTVISSCTKQNVWSPSLPVCTQTNSQDGNGVPNWIYGLTATVIIVIAVVTSVVLFRCRNRIKSSKYEDVVSRKKANENDYDATHNTTAGEEYEEIEISTQNNKVYYKNKDGARKTNQSRIYENIEEDTKTTKHNKTFGNVEESVKKSKTNKTYENMENMEGGIIKAKQKKAYENMDEVKKAMNSKNGKHLGGWSYMKHSSPSGHKDVHKSKKSNTLN